ncbi:hypothetical protein [Sporosarcina psychrophila]|uniref:DNA polymerase III beta sliding clamp C-terminal domain-containing protein n=1 Tax=Sporosarcina psychrophila TaxID=1476 RepID=A0ABV2KDJ5_SPOPS
MEKVNSLEFVHGDLYGVAMDVVKKWVHKQNTRPVLQYAQHTVDGDIVATDSHRLIKIRKIHGFKEEYLVDPKHFNFAKGNYPNTEQLSSRDEHIETIVLSKEHIKLWLQLFKSMNQTLIIMKERMGIAKMCFKENHIEIELSVHKVIIQLPHEVYQKPDMDAVSFRVEYMRDALEAHMKMNSEQLTFNFRGPHKPMIMDDDRAVMTMILPVRTT